MNVGQLGWVKLLPKPPSNGCGNVAPGLGALMMEVEEESADEVEALEGATIDEGDPESVGGMALAVEEKVGLLAAEDAGVAVAVEGPLNAEEPKRSPFCRR